MNYEIHVDPRSRKTGDGTREAPYSSVAEAVGALKTRREENDLSSYDELRIVLGDGSVSARVDGSSRIRSMRFGEREAILARHPSYDTDHPTTGGFLFADWWGKPWERGNIRTAVKLGEPGAGIGWRLDVDAAGAHAVWIAYSIGEKARHSEISVQIDSAQASPRRLSTTLSHSDQGQTGRYALQYAMVGSWELPAGSCEIDVVNSSGGPLAIHALIVTSDPAWKPQDGFEILQWWGDYRITNLGENEALYLLQSEAAVRTHGSVEIPRSEPPGKRDRLVARPDEIPDWSRWDLVDLHVFPAWGWVNQVIGIESVDRDASTIRVDSPQDIRPGNRYFLAGSPEAMSEPGEFSHDPRANRISYIPFGDEVDSSAAVVARLRTLIRVTGSYIAFEGLTFADTDYDVPDGGYAPQQAAVVFSGASSCRVTRCRFEHLAGYAMRLEEKSRDVRVTGCTMTRLGGGGIMLVGNDETQPRNNHFVANHIVGCGRLFKHVAGIYITSGSGNRIAHNRITDMPRYAISAKSSEGSSSHENIIEYNDIANMNLETNDTGAIETLGKDRTPSGNVIRYNRIRNVVGLKTTQTGEFLTPHYTWGIYLDDFSSGTVISGNIVDGTVLGGVNLHGGKDNVIENNILLHGSERQISFSPYFNDPNDRYMEGNVCRRNIIAGAPSRFFIFGRQGMWRNEVLSECDYNCYFRYGGDLTSEGEDATPAGRYSAWVDAGFDAHSIVADPKLLHDARGFAYPSPDSPIWQFGFEPIPIDRIGPEGYRGTY